jgi:hypothetical protein
MNEHIKKYNTHLVYVLSIDDGEKFYVGSHNGNRTYTEVGILSQSGNPLQKEACRTRNWDAYYTRVKLESVEQYETEEEALRREQELLDSMFNVLPKEMILNKTKFGNHVSSKYAYIHDDDWKERYAEVMRKPKACSTERMGRRPRNEN